MTWISYPHSNLIWYIVFSEVARLFTASGFVCVTHLRHVYITLSVEYGNALFNKFTKILQNTCNGICKEFLGEKDPPTMEDIINLIPEERRVIVQLK